MSSDGDSDVGCTDDDPENGKSPFHPFTALVVNCEYSLKEKEG
jgi:hypothetical protein